MATLVTLCLFRTGERLSSLKWWASGVGMDVKSVDALDGGLWESLVESTESQLFHSPRWLRVLAETYGFVPRALVAVEDGAPRAGFVYCEIDDLRGERVASLPFSDFCDPIVSDAESWRLLSKAGSFLFDRKMLMRVLQRPEPLGDERLEKYRQARWHSVDLQRSTDEIREGLAGTTRNRLRKAEGVGAEVRPARDRDELRQFYLLHLRTRKHKYRLLAQPYRMFEIIWDEFIEAGSGTLLVAMAGGRVVAGTMFLGHQNKLYYKFNASDPAFLPAAPNDLLVWRGIEMAVADGYSMLDFGLTDWDQAGLLRFKRKYATQEGTISFLRSQPSHEADSLGELLASITELYTAASVPDEITERAGETLYRLFA